jgi:hypothetical protein
VSSDAAPAVRIVRLAVIGVVFAAAALAIPTGGVLKASGAGAPKADTDAALIGAFSGPDRQLVARGRAARGVGTKPSLDLKDLSGGGLLPLTGAGRPVVLTFVEPDCASCGDEIAKLAVVSIVFLDSVYVAVAAPDGQGAAVMRMLDEQGGTGIVLAGEDTGGTVAKALGVTKRPTTIVVGTSGTLDAVWSEPVPLNDFYTFMSKAYGLKKGG